MTIVWFHTADDIQADGIFQIARIEIDQVVSPLRRDVIQQFLGEIAVRVNHPDTMAQRDVLQD